MRRYGWFPWRPWTWWSAWLDARKNIPSPAATALSETERQIQSGVNTSIRNAEQWFKKQADPAEGKLAELRKARQEIYEPEYRQIQERIGRRDVLVYLSPLTHLILLALLTIGELAFNIVAFNILQEPTLYTVLMASAVGVAIPICAYALGIWIRQWPPPWWATTLNLVGLVVILGGVLTAINRIRLAYLQELAPEFVQAHPELDEAFLAINILLLVAAAVVTYLAYDPEPRFSQAKKKLDRVNASVQRLEGKLDQWANTFRTEVEMLKETGWGLMAYYRKVNRRRREKVPRYFDDDADKNYLPAFVALQKIDEYTPSGPQTAVAAQARASKD